MDVTWTWLLPVILGAAMQVVSVLRFERLRPGVPYSIWSFASAEPGRVRLLRAGGVALALFGALMFVSSRDAAWLISPLLVGASFVPAIIAIVVVNRRSAGSPTRGRATDPGE